MRCEDGREGHGGLSMPEQEERYNEELTSKGLQKRSNAKSANRSPQGVQNAEQNNKGYQRKTKEPRNGHKRHTLPDARGLGVRVAEAVTKHVRSVWCARLHV